MSKKTNKQTTGKQPSLKKQKPKNVTKQTTTNGNSQNFKKPNVVKKPQQIFDTDSSRNVGISLWSEETLQAITKKSGQAAIANEYQVHYWAINVRITAQDGSRLDVSIPTVFFNYKQEVSSAHIDFELTDVDDVSNALLVIHNIEVNKILGALQEEWAEAALATTVEYISTNLNSVHRHPGGRRQSFSGTDYQKAADADTGIVFPLSEGVNKSNFASIIAHEGGKTYLAHTEYRVANGKVEGDTGKITYTKGRCASYVAAPTHHVSDIERMFGYKDTVQKYSISDELVIDDNPLFINLTEWWDKLNYKANTEFVKPENVTKKVDTSPASNKFTDYKAPTKQPNGNLKQQIISYEVADDGEPDEYLSPQTIEKIIAYALENYSLEIPEFDMIETFTQEQRNDEMNKLEMYYYTIAEDDIEGIEDPEMLGYYGLTVDDTTEDDLVELYDLVITELAEEMIARLNDETADSHSYDIMRNGLISMGAHPDYVRDASDEQIEIWYENAIGN